VSGPPPPLAPSPFLSPLNPFLLPLSLSSPAQIVDLGAWSDVALKALPPILALLPDEDFKCVRCGASARRLFFRQPSTRARSHLFPPFFPLTPCRPADAGETVASANLPSVLAGLVSSLHESGLEVRR
jgi:hypothetical protein